MNLYAESSAVLAWLFGQQDGLEVRRHLIAAKSVIASDLTVVECDRILVRILAAGQISEVEGAARRERLARLTSAWVLLRLSGDVLERARRAFPSEPVRTLDALHLASALLARTAVDDLALLSLDERIRDNARQLGFVVVP